MPNAHRSILPLVLLALAGGSHAAVPDSFSYQGYLTDNAGTPVTAAVEMTFSLYNVATSGSALWTDTRMVILEGGLFSESLGDVVNPFPPGLFDGPLFLGIRVAADVEMTPRRPITTVGFSFRSQDADALQGRTAAELDQSAAVAALQANTVLQLDTVLGVGGGGEAQIVAPGGLEAANSAAGPDLIVGGLDGSSSGDDGVIASAPGLPGSDLIFETNDAFRIDLDNDGSGEDADFVINDRNENEVFNVEENGEVRLHGATSLTAADDGATGPILTFTGETSDQTESGRIRFREGTASTNLRGGYVHYDGAANKLHIGVHDTSDNVVANDEDIITIERSSGQVGIGTTSPNRELTVNDTDGSSGAIINVTAPNRELLMGVNQSSGGIIAMQTNNDLQFRTDGSTRMILQSTGELTLKNGLQNDYGSGVTLNLEPFALVLFNENDGIVKKTPNVQSVTLDTGSTNYDVVIDGPCDNPTLSVPPTDDLAIVATPYGNELISVVRISQVCQQDFDRRVTIDFRDGFGFNQEVDFSLIVYKP